VRSSCVTGGCVAPGAMCTVHADCSLPPAGVEQSPPPTFVNVRGRLIANDTGDLERHIVSLQEVRRRHAVAAGCNARALPSPPSLPLTIPWLMFPRAALVSQENRRLRADLRKFAAVTASQQPAFDGSDRQFAQRTLSESVHDGSQRAGDAAAARFAKRTRLGSVAEHRDASLSPVLSAQEPEERVVASSRRRMVAMSMTMDESMYQPLMGGDVTHVPSPRHSRRRSCCVIS
jgi:hypothetical protein